MNFADEEKFAEQYPLAAFETCDDGPVKIAVLGDYGVVEMHSTFTGEPHTGEVELWICAEMTPCYECGEPTRFFVWELTGTRQFVCSKECGSRAAQTVWPRRPGRIE